MGVVFTDKAVPPWGGLVLFAGLAREVGSEAALREALPFKLQSPNATDPVEIVPAFTVNAVFQSLMRRQLQHIELADQVLDLDSTIVERYGSFHW